MAKYSKYEDGELHTVQDAKPETFRANLYLYARRKKITAKSYIDWTTLPEPTVVFRLGSEPLGELPGAPKRGRPEQ